MKFAQIVLQVRDGTVLIKHNYISNHNFRAGSSILKNGAINIRRLLVVFTNKIR